MTNVTKLAKKRIPKMVGLASRNDPHGKARLRAELWEDDSLISFGHNSSVTFEKDPDRPERIGSCAEEAAIRRAFSSTRPNNAVLIVARAKQIERFGPFVQGNAKPCKKCFNLMKRYGIKTVVYTTEFSKYASDEEFIVETIDKNDTHNL